MGESDKKYNAFDNCHEPLISLHAFILILFLILHSAKIHGFIKEEQNLAETYFKNQGPIPRMFINFVQDSGPLTQYERHYDLWKYDYMSHV